MSSRFKEANNASPTGTDLTASGVNSEKSSSLLTRSVYYYKSEYANKFCPDMLSALHSGARLSGGVPFWYTIGPSVESLTDVTSGVGSEMAIASRFVGKVQAWDPCPKKRKMSQDNPLMFGACNEFPLSKSKFLFVDPPWGDKYDRATKTLDLTDPIFWLDLVERGSAVNPKVVVMKTPRNIKCHKWFNQAFHVRAHGADIGYIVAMNKGFSKDLKPYYELFDQSKFYVEVISEETKIMMGIKPDPLAEPSVIPYQKYERSPLLDEGRDIEDVVRSHDEGNVFAQFDEHDAVLIEQFEETVLEDENGIPTNYIGKENIANLQRDIPKVISVPVLKKEVESGDKPIENPPSNNVPHEEVTEANPRVIMNADPPIPIIPNVVEVEIPLQTEQISEPIIEVPSSAVNTEASPDTKLETVRVTTVETEEEIEDKIDQGGATPSEPIAQDSVLSVDPQVMNNAGLEPNCSDDFLPNPDVPDVIFESAAGSLTEGWTTEDIDEIVSTNFSDNVLLNSLWDLIKEFWEKIREYPAIKDFVDKFLKNVSSEEIDELPGEWAHQDFTKDPRIFKLTGDCEASAFFLKGTLITAYHATKGKAIDFKGLKLACRGFDEDLDIAWYGGDFDGFSKPKHNTHVFAATPSKKLTGNVIATNPFQVRFHGSPVPGLSGSPLFDFRNRVVGIYSNHLLGVGDYITLSTKSVWVEMVNSKLNELGRINAYVPCGQGKSTYLVSHLVKSGKRPLVIVPRAALPKEVAKRVGPNARGFAGEEKIQEDGCEALFLTHGKFLNAVKRNPDRFASYDVIMVDEAHDCTGLTRAVIEWVDQIWKKNAVLMTGSPNGAKFGVSASKQSKFPVKTETLPQKEGLTPEQMVTHLRKNCLAGSHLIQVPSTTFAKKCQNLLSRPEKSAIISREQLNAKGLAHFEKLIEDNRVIWLFATPVVNIGFTLNVDSVTLQGTVLNSESPVGQVTSLEKRNLTNSELYQWYGRVGRVKEGKRSSPVDLV